MNKKPKLIRLFLVLFLLFFIPWVLVLYTGILIYFPYSENGKSRYIRVTGSVASYLGADWSSSSEIPQVCKYAIVVAEDSEFFQHHGIHIPSIVSSIKENFRNKKILSGASTLTQQLVKNAFLSRDKTYFRKSREILGAILLDFFYSKDKILTWYLNVVEFGPNIYGIKEAAKIYFKKQVRDLNKRDCAVLATFLTRPIFFGSSYLKNQQPLGFQRRFHRIILSLSN
jgi:monofunctional glycosyltransferase